MADGSSPDEIYNRVLSDPLMAQRMGNVEKDADAALKGFYSNLEKTKKKLDYVEAQNQFAIRNAPTEIMSPPIGIDSALAAGNSLTGPPKPTSLYDNSENINNLINKLGSVEQIADDPYQWAKPYTFNTGKLNADIDRYYEHPLYDKLGYNPFRDNEAIYNEKASWLDDNRRMWGQWFGLTWQGIKPMWGGSSDPEEFNRRNTIAQTTKGGVGGFVTNQLSSFSYTAGVAASFLVQSAALAFVTGATGGIAAEATIPGMAALGARAGTLLGLVKGFSATKKVMDGGNIARSVYGSVKGVGTAFTAAEKLGLPIQTAKTLYALNKGIKGYEGLTKLAKISTTTGAFLRDVVAVNGSYAEASLEGDSEQVKFADDLMGQHYRDNGVMAEGKDAERIYDLAREAGFKTTLYNMPLLMITNNVVFGKAFRGFKPKWLAQAELTGKIPMDILENTRWKKAGVNAYEIAPEGFKKFMVGNYWKQQPGKVAMGMLNYGKANFFEGAQEVMQETISGSIDEYYKKIYEDPSLAGARQYWASLKNGTAAQISGQGLQTFLAGFTMGGILQIPQNLFMGYMPRIQYGKVGYEEYQAKRKAQTESVVSALNDVVMNTGKYASLIEENLIHQKNLSKEMQNAEMANDKKGYLDAKNKSMFGHISTLIEHGHYDTFLDSMNEMNEWTDQELSDAFGAPIEGDGNNKPIRERLNSSIKETEDIKKRYDTLNERFANPFNPSRYKKGTEEWYAETDRKKAYEDVKFHTIYANFAFNKALSRMNSILEDMTGPNKPFSNFSTNDIMPFFHPAQIRDRRKQMVDEIKIYEAGDAPQKKMAASISKKLEAFDALAEDINAFRELIDEGRQPVTKTLTQEQESAKTKKGEEINNNLSKSYLKYVKVLAADTNQRILDEDVYPSLNGIRDYMALDKDSRAYGEYINHLHDPENFFTVYNRRAKSIRDGMKKAAETTRNAMKRFQGMADENDGVFSRIGDAGAWLEQDSVDAFMDGGPKDDQIVFMNLDAPYGPVDKTSDKYKKLRKIIDDYRAITPKENPDENLDVKLPEGFRVVAEGEALPAGDYTHYMNYKGTGINITNAPAKEPTETEKATAAAKAAMSNQPKPPIKPTIIAGDVIYVTPTNDIEALIKTSPDKYVNGDDIINDETDGKKTKAQIAKIFKDITDSGKTVITTSGVAIHGDAPMATKVFLSTDKVAIMKTLRSEGNENVEIAARNLMDRENAFREKFPSRAEELPTGVSLEDVIGKKKPTKEAGRIALINKINIATLDDLNKLEDNITEALEKDSHYLIRYGLSSREITELFNKRKEELVKDPIFDSIKKGATLLMKDGSRLYVETKTRDGVPLVVKPGKTAHSKMKESDLQNIERVFNPGEPIPDVITEPTTPQTKEVAVENMKNKKEFLADSAARTAANKKADTKTDKEANDDLLNSICT